MPPLNRLPCGQFFPGEFPRPPRSTVGNSPVIPPVYYGSLPVVAGGTAGTVGKGGTSDIPVPGPNRPGEGRPGTPGNPATNGPVTPGNGAPAGIPPPGPGTGGVGGPVIRPGGPATGGGAAVECRRCIVSNPPVPCPPGTRGPDRVIRTLQICTPLDANADAAEANRRKRSGRGFSDNGPWNDNANGLCLVSNGNLFNGCIPDPNLCVTIPGRNILQENPFANDGNIGIFEPQGTGDGNGSVVINSVRNTNTTLQANTAATVSPSRPTDSTFGGRVNYVTSPSEQRLSNGSQIDNSRLVSQTLLRQIPKKQETVFNLEDPNLLKNASVSSSYNKTYGLLNELYNLFKRPPSNSTQLVNNSLYLDTFNELVSEEVQYFLNKENTSSVWDESKLDSLTNEKITISLKSDLLTALNNIHTIANEPISINNFISVIKNHLINGTMYEFDPNYYKYIFNSQIKDSVVNYRVEGESYKGLQASIGFFELSSTIADFTKYNDVWKRDDLKRTRFLLEDINSKIPALQMDGNSSPMYLKNSGIPIIQITQEASSYLEIGDGAGYYINASSLKSPEYPLVIQNELSSARYISPEVREGVLKTLGTSLGIILTVESPSTTNEFSANYNPSADIYPMYFRINFETLKDIENPNSVINSMSATYIRLSDEDAIRHSRNYSFNTTKINLDFRDPIIHYARDTSSITIELDDFNFRNFGDNRSIVSEDIILRNVPAGIILSPGMGSAHNPFNSRSKISSFTNEKVVRTMELIPTFEYSQQTIQKPSLEVSNIYKLFEQPYFGLYEKYIESDIESDIYTFNPNSEQFKKSYFTNLEYSNTLTDSSYIEKSIESKIVALVDKLISVSGVSSLTWWDVFRRLEINDLGKLNSNNVENIIKSLSSGWRGGIKIYNILTRKNMKTTGIPEDAEIIDDKIILYEMNRLFKS